VRSMGSVIVVEIVSVNLGAEIENLSGRQSAA
jgi:hypothetical protein